MDGAFLELNSEAVEGEVDEYWRETYKIQKVFNQKVKKMQMERDELERERKKKRRTAEDGGDEAKDDGGDFHPPQSLAVCNTVMDNMKDFKVGKQDHCMLNHYCMFFWCNLEI